MLNIDHEHGKGSLTKAKCWGISLPVFPNHILEDSYPVACRIDDFELAEGLDLTQETPGFNPT